MQFSICLQLQLGPSGTHVGDRFWCKLVPFASRRSEMSRSGYRSFLEIRLSPLKLTQSRSEPYFLWIMRTGAPWGECEGWINPVARFSLMNLHRATSSSWDKE